MSYASKFLIARGQDCLVGSPAVSAHVSMKRATKTVRDLGARDAYWDGLIDATVASGEIIAIGDTKYLAQTVENDPASGEVHFFATKVNADLVHSRQVDTLDENNNIVKVWAVLNSDVPAFGEIITSNLRQFDHGLVDNARYLFQVPKAINAQFLDRMVFNGQNYQVESVDDIMLAGIVRLQCSQDVRV